MAVRSVFISSVQRGFEHVRDAVREAVESMGMHPVMAETTGARPSSPRTGLLDEVTRSDAFLVILGEHYGDTVENGFSPTEDEFNRAVRLGKPILVLVQDGVTREPAQEEFLRRVSAGGWDRGKLYGKFSSAADVTVAAVRALRALDTDPSEDEPSAQERAAELATGEPSRGQGSGVRLRTAVVPLATVRIIDPLKLEDEDLEEAIVGLARAARLVPQQIGLQASSSSIGVALQSSQPVNWTTVSATVGADGAVVSEGSVAGEGPFGGSLVDEAKVAAAIAASCGFAAKCWERLDDHQEIRRVAVAVAVPDAEYKAFGAAQGNSMHMPSHNPGVVLAPQPAAIVTRTQIDSDETLRLLTVSLKRAFADLGATL
jgi:hypothetical protein